jgi:hypothetical protein
MDAPPAAKSRSRARTPALIAACVAAGVAVWLLLPGGPITETAPASSMRVRTPAIKAYEDRWWDSAMDRMGRLCSTLKPTAQARYGFAVLVDASGRIIRAEVKGDSFDATLAPRIEQALRETALPAFTPDQAAQKNTLSLRGNLLVDDGRCKLQRT